MGKSAMAFIFSVPPRPLIDEPGVSLDNLGDNGQLNPLSLKPLSLEGYVQDISPSLHYPRREARGWLAARSQVLSSDFKLRTRLPARLVIALGEDRLTALNACFSSSSHHSSASRALTMWNSC